MAAMADSSSNTSQQAVHPMGAGPERRIQRTPPKQLEQVLCPHEVKRFHADDVQTALTCWGQIWFYVGAVLSRYDGQGQSKDTGGACLQTPNSKSTEDSLLDVCRRGLTAIRASFTKSHIIQNHLAPHVPWLLRERNPFPPHSISSSGAPDAAVTTPASRTSSRRDVARRALIGILACDACAAARKSSALEGGCEACLDVILCHNPQFKPRAQDGRRPRDQKNKPGSKQSTSCTHSAFIEILLMGNKTRKKPANFDTTNAQSNRTSSEAMHNVPRRDKRTSAVIRQKRRKVGYLLAEVCFATPTALCITSLAASAASSPSRKVSPDRTTANEVTPSGENKTEAPGLTSCALMGLRIAEDARNKGLAKQLVVLWLTLCQKLGLNPATRRMDKPVICLVLQRLGALIARITGGCSALVHVRKSCSFDAEIPRASVAGVEVLVFPLVCTDFLFQVFRRNTNTMS
eukprot:INCI596.1.p1 GENE.INCI596.1~~INCI596.1.p1  ORF type:complete len:527 (+),score=97.27 INCI596.1:201-1583(+)